MSYKSRQIFVSGVKPTGRPHLGNYFGAMRQLVELQDSSHKGYVFIADYHALTTLKNPDELRQSTFDVTLDYLALGLDPDKTIIFKQSDISEHTELAWIFNCITTMPYLMRAHAFKNAEAKNKNISVGTFDYPMLMAADILLYDPDIVPVGQDQKQHIEFARDTAEKFNHAFEDTFRIPKAHILETVAVVPGTDGQKMSKSYKNTISLFASRDKISKAVMGIVTDSKSSRPEHVYAIHNLFKSKSELATLYEGNIGKYKVLKEALVEEIDEFMSPLREARMKYAENPEKVKEILQKGGEEARQVASKKMKQIRALIGATL